MYDLSNKKRSFKCSNSTYRNLLQLAYDNGWEPTNTIINEKFLRLRFEGKDENFIEEALKKAKEDIGYFEHCSYNKVTKQDAKNIAIALRKATIDDEEYKKLVNDFIAFCEEDGFVIF